MYVTNLITIGHPTFSRQIVSMPYHSLDYPDTFSPCINAALVQALVSNWYPVYWLRPHCSSCHCVNYGFGGWLRVGLAPTNYWPHLLVALNWMHLYTLWVCNITHHIPFNIKRLLLIQVFFIINVHWCLGIWCKMSGSNFILIRHFWLAIDKNLS